MQPSKLTAEEFLSSPHGAWFHDLFHADLGKTVGFAVLDFLSDPGRQQRMEDAEIHHDRPPLAGVIFELEFLPEVSAWVRGYSSEHRLRQTGKRPTHLSHFIRAATMQVMLGRGWRPVGRKGSLVGVGAVIVGKAERFVPPKEHPGFDLWTERHPLWTPRPSRTAPKRSPGRGARPGLPESAAAGRTRAQEMRDLLAGHSPAIVRRKLKVSTDTLRNWRNQARRDDGEDVRARCSQPTRRAVEDARRVYGGGEPGQPG